jgi:hypothetical protein
MRAEEGMNLLGMPHSPMATGAMNLRAHQPSMSAALTEERVRNLFFANFTMLNHLRMFSCPSSSSHHAQLAWWGLCKSCRGSRLWVLVTQLVNVGRGSRRGEI